MSQQNRAFNFSAGPSMLPIEVLEKCSSDMLNYKNSGMSVMEMSHRSPEFISIANDTVKLFYKVMNIPINYKVLFIHGGASALFASIPLNLFKNGVADYVVTGNFSALAAKEAKKYLSVNIAATTEEENFRRIPKQEELNITPNADYFHICFNNTVFGTRFNYIPSTGGVPLVADISSCILAEPIDVSKFGVLYAGVQKNIAPAGMAVLIIREDLLQKCQKSTPAIFDFSAQSQKASMYNTPNCWSIYVTKLVLEHIEATGGVHAMALRNAKKAALIYDYIDNSSLYQNNVNVTDRSNSNVIFRTNNEELDKKFVKESEQAGFLNLAGHRAAGGMRASIYNSMPIEGVIALINFMKEFEKANG